VRHEVEYDHGLHVRMTLYFLISLKSYVIVRDTKCPEIVLGYS
jgi:hypothetical protein